MVLDLCVSLTEQYTLIFLVLFGLCLQMV